MPVPMVHNAGAYGPPGASNEETDYGSQSFDRIDAKSMRYAFELNTIAPLMLTKALLPNLQEAASLFRQPWVALKRTVQVDPTHTVPPKLESTWLERTCQLI